MWINIKKALLSNKESWFSDGESKYSYWQICEIAEKNAETLREKLNTGTKCGVLCENEMMTAIGILSCWAAQMIPVPMSMNYGEHSCRNIIASSELKYLVSDCAKYGERLLVCTYEMKEKRWNGEFEQQGFDRELENVAAIMNTSGTTGMPKGVMITNDGMWRNVLNIAEYFKISKGENILIARPLYHCAVMSGEFLISLYKGLNLVFFRGEYNPIGVVRYINQYNIRVMCGTPTLFVQISNYVNRIKQKLQLRVIALSGEVLTSKNAQIIRRTFATTEIYNVYGLTEASPRVSYLPPDKFDECPESVGIPLRDTQITIRDNEGNIVKKNIIGNIYVESKGLMKGYYRSIEETLNKLTSFGLNTGDVGYLNDDGYLFILSRTDDMIILGGMNIYPAEVEKIILEFPFVLETIVYGMQSERGQRIATNIVLRDEYKDITKHDVMQAFSKKMPKYLIPSTLQILDKLERNGSGKLVRPRMQNIVSNDYCCGLQCNYCSE